MAKTTFVLEAEEAKAVHAYMRVVEAQRKATDGQRAMNREGGKGERIMGDMARSAGTWLASFATIGTVVQGVRAVISELEKAVQLRKEMYEISLTTEQAAMKIAHLRRDVSQGGISTVTKDIEEIARAGNIALDVASKALFYSESGMGAGTARAKEAAISIGQFAAPAGLTPEETMLIPKLFKLTKANDQKSQLQILNQLYVATKESIAETGEYIQPFISTVVSDLERGFTLTQSMARMTAAIETTGSIAEAATTSSRIVDITAGRSEQGLRFMTEQAKKRGIDFTKLTDPQRFELGRQIYHEAQAAGTMDELKTKLDVRGFAAMRSTYSEVGEGKYFEMIPQIDAALGSTAVQQMAKQYQETQTAEATQMATRLRMAQTKTGREAQPAEILRKMSEAMQLQVVGKQRGMSELIGLGLTPGGLKQHKAARMILLENIERGLELAEPGGEWATELGELRGKIVPQRGATGEELPPEINIFKTHPEFVERAYRATKGFTLVESEGRARGGEGLGEWTSAYERGFEAYYGLGEEIKTSNEKQIQLLREIRDTLRGRATGGVGTDQGAMD